MNLSRSFLRTVVAFEIVAIFFFGTLFVLDWPEKDLDSMRSEDAGSLKGAFAKSRAEQRSYSPFPDNHVIDLKKALVDGGYLNSIPDDPLRQRTFNTATRVMDHPTARFHLDS